MTAKRYNLLALKEKCKEFIKANVDSLSFEDLFSLSSIEEYASILEKRNNSSNSISSESGGIGNSEGVRNSGNIRNSGSIGDSRSIGNGGEND